MRSSAPRLKTKLDATKCWWSRVELRRRGEDAPERVRVVPRRARVDLARPAREVPERRRGRLLRVVRPA